MVSADMKAIVSHVLYQGIPPPQAPVTTATVSPDASDAGWHAEDVTVTLTPVASPGQTLAGLTVTLTGAQNDAINTNGSPAEVVVNAEGTTVVTYSARDTALRVEAPKQLTIRIDKTPPIITSSVSPDPDVQGWHNDDVTVTFDATDALSGVADVTPPVTVTADGAGQQGVGTAIDLAGNTAVAVVEVNIHRQRPILTVQGSATWFLAEGASNALFRAEIQIGNPSADPIDVTVELLPQFDALATFLTRTFTIAPTSRHTVRAWEDFGLIGASSVRVSAVVSGTSTPADIVVDRTMTFPAAGPAGMHNASGVRQGAQSWTLAEGATTAFDTFVLVANGNPTETLVRATYLTASGEPFVSEQVAQPMGRVTFWPREEHPALRANEFSTFIESLTPDNHVVAERAMYFNNLRAGHAALGVSAASTTWYFAEGFTGGSPDTAFETFLLLANTGHADATATVDYLLDSGEVVTLAYPVKARSRFTIWVDEEGRTLMRVWRAPLSGSASPRITPNRRRARDVLGHSARAGPDHARAAVARGPCHRRGRCALGPVGICRRQAGARGTVATALRHVFPRCQSEPRAHHRASDVRAGRRPWHRGRRLRCSERTHQHLDGDGGRPCGASIRHVPGQRGQRRVRQHRGGDVRGRACSLHGAVVQRRPRQHGHAMARGDRHAPAPRRAGLRPLAQGPLTRPERR
jgi:hypothetical protein